MESYRVIFSPEAEAQLVAIYRRISGKTAPTIADRFTGAIVDYCEKLESLSASRHTSRRFAARAAHDWIPPSRHDRFCGRSRRRDDHRHFLRRSGF